MYFVDVPETNVRQDGWFFSLSPRDFSRNDMTATKFKYRERTWELTFSSPEATLRLVSTKNRDLWPCPTPEARDSRTSRHSGHAQSQV